MFNLLSRLRNLDTSTSRVEVFKLAVKALVILDRDGDSTPANMLCNKLPYADRGRMLTWFADFARCSVHVDGNSGLIVFERDATSNHAAAAAAPWWDYASRHLPLTTERTLMSDLSFTSAVEGINHAYTKEYIQVLGLTALQSMYDHGTVTLGISLCKRLDMLDRARMLNWLAQHGNCDVVSVIKYPYLTSSDKGIHRMSDAEATPWWGRLEHQKEIGQGVLGDLLERALEAANNDHSCGEDLCEEILDALLPIKSGTTGFR